MTQLSRLACALGLFLAGSVSFAQDILYEHHIFASQAVAVGDVNGDGISDFALGSPNDGRGKVRVLSGATQLALFTFHGDLQAPLLGSCLAAIGDVDLDGIPDLAASTQGYVFGAYSQQGYVRVFSLGTGQILYTITAAVAIDRFGYSVAPAGDINGDGRQDFAVGAPQVFVWGGGDHYTVTSNGPGYVQVLSGENGSLLRTLIGVDYYGGFGGSIANGGDLNGDGVDDMLVSQFILPTLLVGKAKVRAFSGASGALLLQVRTKGGARVSSIGDVNADGVNEFALTELVSGVRVISGATGSPLYTRQGIDAYDEFGESICGIGDIDGDGAPELMIGAAQDGVSGVPYSPGPGYVQVLSGRSGNVLKTLVGDSLDQGFGAAVARAGDLDADGKEEMIVTSVSHGVGSGVVRVFSGRDGFSSPTNYCVGDYNLTGQASIGHIGSTSVSANQWTMTLAGAEPGKFGLLYCGTSPTSKHFSATNLPGYMCVGAPTIRLGPAQLISAQGTLQRTVDLGPASPFSIGSTWYFQFAYYSNPAHPNSSDALAVTFTP